MGRVPVLFMRINVAKEDVYLCRILAVEVRRVKCVFPRNEVQKEMSTMTAEGSEDCCSRFPYISHIVFILHLYS